MLSHNPLIDSKYLKPILNNTGIVPFEANLLFLLIHQIKNH